MENTSEKLDFKRVLPIFIIVLVDLLGMTIILPLLPLYSASYGADPFMIGVLSATYPIMQLIGAPILGGLSDRFGRRPVLIVSQIGTFVGFIMLGFANALPLLFLSRLIDGLSGANYVAAQAAITDVTTEKNRTQGLGLIGAAFGLGFTMGPAIAGIALALTNNNYHVPAFIAAFFSFVSIILTSVWFTETLSVEKRGKKEKSNLNLFQRYSRAFSNPLIGTILLLVFMQQLVFGSYENLFALFSLSRLGLGASTNSLLFVFIGVVLVFVQGYFIGKWSKRFGERKLVIAGLALLSVGLILTAITPQQPAPWYTKADMMIQLATNGTGEVSSIAVDLPDDTNTGWLGFAWIVLASVPCAIGGGILSPSLNSLLTKRVSPTEIGSALGVSTSLVSLANAITPIFGGTLFQILGSTAPFLLGGIVLAVLMVWSLQAINDQSTVVVPA